MASRHIGKLDRESHKLSALAAHAHAACTPVHKTRKIARKISQRRKMSGRLFALPTERKFPIHDAYHAKLALTHLERMIGRHGFHKEYASEARKVLAAVRKHWPGVVACEEDLVRKIRSQFRL